MNVYVYNAALLCEDCGETTIIKLKREGKIDTNDSNDFPQGPYPDGGGEADSPQHCDCCNVFLENPLTDDGIKWLRDALKERRVQPSEVRQQWIEFYRDVLPVPGKVRAVDITLYVEIAPDTETIYGELSDVLDALAEQYQHNEEAHVYLTQLASNARQIEVNKRQRPAIEVEPQSDRDTGFYAGEAEDDGQET